MRLSRATAVVLVVVGALTLLGTGSNAARPTGFPRVWRVVDAALVGRTEGASTRTLHSVWYLRSDTGDLMAFLYTTRTEPRGRTSRPATCGGLRYTGRYVNETRNAGQGWFGLVTDQDDATARVKITRRVAVYPNPNAPPICVEEFGTLTGETGALGGLDGTFTLRNDEVLVFKPR